MSKYTTEVRFICEEKSGLDISVNSNDVNNIIANSRITLPGKINIKGEN